MAEIREIVATVRAVRPVDIETHDRALDLVEQHRFSLYDGLILAAALQAGCTTLYTEDLQHGRIIGRLTIRNPFAGE